MFGECRSRKLVAFVLMWMAPFNCCFKIAAAADWVAMRAPAATAAAFTGSGPLRRDFGGVFGEILGNVFVEESSRVLVDGVSGGMILIGRMEVFVVMLDFVLPVTLRLVEIK